MISQVLRDARKYEETAENRISGEDRPAFHLSPRTGWMNDPNGFSWYQGAYHLFYQYYPYSPHWDSMHWGHVVSEDLLHWRYLPAALAPDSPCDRDGCFSGSAAELPDGRQLLLYTGVAKGHDGKDIQTQCIAVGDGLDYEKYPGNPVLDIRSLQAVPGDCGAQDSPAGQRQRTEGQPEGTAARTLPEDASPNDFRDPKVWREEDGSYSCVVANCDSAHDGCLLLCKSPDGFHWRAESVLLKNHGRFGRMWECPDFFSLDGKQVVLISPQDMLPKGFEYHNGNGTVCMIGAYDRETQKFEAEHDQAVDYGIDYYAPQTLLSPDGRRIMVAWMQNWDTCNLHAPDGLWQGQLALPRELSLRDGRLIQVPVRELLALRHNRTAYAHVPVSGTVSLPGLQGRTLDLELAIRPAENAPLYRKFALRFAQDSQYRTSVSYRPYESILKLDRKFSGSRRAIIHQRRCLVRDKGGCLKLRLILDRFSAEVFVNDGEQVLSATLFTDQTAQGISFFADGEVVMDVVKYDLQ